MIVAPHRQYVCLEVGFWRNPKHLTFARVLKNPLAPALIARLREFILTDGEQGVLAAKYSADDIAAAVEWTGPPRLLARALQTAGVLTRWRGRFRYPDWGRTPTGYWERKKAADRERNRLNRERGKGDGVRGASADGPRTVHGQSADGSRTKRDQASKRPRTDRRTGRAEGASPGAPRGGGVGIADALGKAEADELVRFFLENYPKLRKPQICEKLIRALSKPEADQLRYGLGVHLPPYRALVNKPRWRFVPFADTYLKESTFWEHRRPVETASKPVSKRQAEKLRVEEEKIAAAQLRREDEERAKFARQGEIRKRLKAEGLKGDDLESAVLREIEAVN